MFLWIAFVLIVGVGLTKKYEKSKYFDIGVYGTALIFFFALNLWMPTFKGIVYNILYLIVFYLALEHVWGKNEAKDTLKPEELNYSIMDTILEGEENIEWKEEESTGFLLFMTFVWGISLYLGSYLILEYWQEIEQGIEQKIGVAGSLRLRVYMWFLYSYFVLQSLVGFIKNIFKLRNRFSNFRQIKTTQELKQLD